MNPDVLLRYLPSLISGFGVTIFCWSAGGVLGMMLGFAIALARRAPFPPLQWALRVFIEVFRGTPFLMQLFLLYSGGPYIGLRLSATAAGVSASASAFIPRPISPRYSAPDSPRFRAARSRPRPASAWRPIDTMLRVALPAALIAAVPSIVNMLIVLSKETVVLSIITVPELMYQMQTMAAETFTAFDAIFAMAVFYWLLVEVVSRIGARVEARVTAFLAAEGARA